MIQGRVGGGGVLFQETSQTRKELNIQGRGGGFSSLVPLLFQGI